MFPCQAEASPLTGIITHSAISSISVFPSLPAAFFPVYHKAGAVSNRYKENRPLYRRGAAACSLGFILLFLRQTS